MKVVATICSRVKDENPELLPARLRYLAPHISQTQKHAEHAGLPFYVLSGKYGIISGEEMIPNYDYYLEPGAVDALSVGIAEQFKTHGITELDFYTEAKPSWVPYETAVQKAAAVAGIKLAVFPLLES